MKQPFCEASRDMNYLRISKKITGKNVLRMGLEGLDQRVRNELLAELNKKWPINDSKYIWVFTLKKEET